MLDAVILILTMCFIILLVTESLLAQKNRRALQHVVHVNGTRGKSTVTRLIEAGLRAGGLRTYCKTTGTLPMVIDTAGMEHLIHRRGKPNIKEQLAIMRWAARQHADVLVVECMAVNPLYQNISQHRMLKADVGVITNVRLDHTEVMGATLPAVADALSNTIPKSGILFTAEENLFDCLQQNACCLGTKICLARPDCTLPDIDFPENIALALAVCLYLGVDRERALNGMLGYHRDPYALSLHRVGRGALFIGGMSINDPQSTELVYRSLCEKLPISEKRLILIVNNRPDRTVRTRQMAELTRRLAPDEVWVMGANRRLFRSMLLRKTPTPPSIRLIACAKKIDFSTLGENDVLYAVGNIALQGKTLMERLREEGIPYVQ